MSTENDRRLALESLLNLDSSPAELKEALSAFPWDSDTPLAIMGPAHVRGALQQLIDGKRSSQDIEDWANLLESREDIGYEPEHEDLLQEVVFELANPAITKELTHSRAVELLGLV